LMEKEERIGHIVPQQGKLILQSPGHAVYGWTRGNSPCPQGKESR